MQRQAFQPLCVGSLVNGRLSALLSVALLIIFAYLSSHFPEHLGTFFIVYFVAAMVITLIIGGRTASALVRDLEYIKKGRMLLSVGRDEVAKLRNRDKTLNDELKKQTLLTVPQIVTFFIIFTILLIPYIRDSIIIFLRNLLHSYIQDPSIVNFVSFLLFYGLFTFIFQVNSLYSRKGMERLGGKLEVPLFYAITENGLLLEERIPLRAPLRISDVKVDTRRRFVEFKVKSPLGGVSRFRLYYEDPRTLEAHLRRLAEQRG